MSAVFVPCVVALFLLGAGTAAAGGKQKCGDATGDGKITAPDGLGILRTALGLDSCEDCFCDVDSSGVIVTTDALTALKFSVGDAVDLDCPSCPTTTTTTTVPLILGCGDPRAGAPACDGYCNVDGQMCVESPAGSGNCQCIFTPIPCGGAAGPPVCSGSCPKTRVCRQIATTCECAFF
jgi:hypothetical protein